jgi:membrane protein
LQTAIRHHLVDEAGGIAFFALLALFPFLAALVALYGLFADTASVTDHLAGLTALLPESGTHIIEGQVRRLATQERDVLGAGAVAALLAALWSANRAMKALFRALTHLHGGRETRGFVARNALTMVFTLGAILFMLIAMAAVVVLPLVLGFLGLGGTTDLLLRLVRWPVLLAAVALFLACVYRYGPCHAEPRWRWVSWGGAFAATAWVLLSAGFSWFVGDAGGGAGTYGPFGAVIGFMTWLWLSAAVVLAGAALNTEMEREARSCRAPKAASGARPSRSATTPARASALERS